MWLHRRCWSTPFSSREEHDANLDQAGAAGAGAAHWPGHAPTPWHPVAVAEDRPGAPPTRSSADTRQVGGGRRLLGADFGAIQQAEHGEGTQQPHRGMTAEQAKQEPQASELRFLVGLAGLEPATERL